MELPATTLKDAFNACDPTQALPAGDQRYVDLTFGRGEEGGAVGRCHKRISLSAQPLVQLFAGHRGCGKSTELRRLQAELEDDGYFVVYVEAESDLDLEDTEPPDVLLALVRSVDRALRDAGFAVDSKLLEDFLLWFAEVVLEKTERREIEAEVRSEAKVSGGVPLFAQLLARFSGWVKTGTASKKAVRQKLERQISQLLDRGRLLVEAARLTVQKYGRKDLVLIVDSLDRVALKDLGGGRNSQEVLFIERGELLKGFDCHQVVTVPISLLFSPKAANLTAIFPDRYLLPMVKIAERLTRERWGEGRDLLVELLAQRVDPEVGFEAAAMETLIDASGGHPRHLMTLVRYAFDFVDDLPITGEAAQKAVRRLANDYGRSIPKAHWVLLAAVYERQGVENDAEHQQMLFNLSVLEYQNRDRWCDVHPAVCSLPEFLEAQTALRRST